MVGSKSGFARQKASKEFFKTDFNTVTKVDIEIPETDPMAGSKVEHKGAARGISSVSSRADQKLMYPEAMTLDYAQAARSGLPSGPTTNTLVAWQKEAARSQSRDVSKITAAQFPPAANSNTKAAPIWVDVATRPPPEELPPNFEFKEPKKPKSSTSLKSSDSSESLKSSGASSSIEPAPVPKAVKKFTPPAKKISSKSDGVFKFVGNGSSTRAPTPPSPKYPPQPSKAIETSEKTYAEIVASKPLPENKVAEVPFTMVNRKDKKKPAPTQQPQHQVNQQLIPTVKHSQNKNKKKVNKVVPAPASLAPSPVVAGVVAKKADSKKQTTIEKKIESKAVDDQKVVPKKVATKVVATKIDMHIVAERSSASKEVVASKKAVQDIQMEDVKDVTHSRVIEDALPAEFAHGMSSSHPNHSFPANSYAVAPPQSKHEDTHSEPKKKRRTAAQRK
jgi:hypothetical protein